jgi:hypothetical protein
LSKVWLLKRTDSSSSTTNTGSFAGWLCMAIPPPQ